MMSYHFLFSFCAWIHRESDKVDEDGPTAGSGKKQLRLSNVGITTSKRKSEEIESNAKGRCKFFQARKLEQLTHFWMLNLITFHVLTILHFLTYKNGFNSGWNFKMPVDEPI